jgi:hypothetical protein
MVAGFVAAGANAATTAADSDNCKTVHLKPGEKPPTGGGMSTSVTAGNGAVSSRTTTATGVLVQSGGSGAGASVAATASTSSEGRTTTVVSTDGSCTVYVQPNK